MGGHVWHDAMPSIGSIVVVLARACMCGICYQVN